jgi:leader peptidase (prepilin peptidase) / N-methyltransferase
MSAAPALLVGAGLGVIVGSLLVPVTRRELAASIARATAGDGALPATATVPASAAQDAPQIDRRQWLLLAAASGVVPALILFRVGWSLIALPPLLMLVGLVQLAYCDITRRLLPKTMVYALGAVVLVSAVVVAGAMHDWRQLAHAVLGGVACFTLFFFINLMNPRWIAFGDVRLSLVVGFGLGWISLMAVVDGFFYANLMAAAVGLALIMLGRAKRGSPLPFGLYLTLSAALVLVIWS